MHDDRFQIKSILLIRLGGLGDVVFTLPAVHAVRRAFPNARLTFLTYKEFAPLLAGFPGIVDVVELNRARYRGLNPKNILTESLSMLVKLWRGKFDLTIDFQGFGETGLLSWWTRAPQRWGTVYRRSRAWAYTRGITRNPAQHPIDCQLDLLQQARGISPDPFFNQMTVPQASMAEARRFFLEWNLKIAKPTLFIQPFSNADHKNWPLDRYLTIARQLRSRGVQVLFGGGPSERAALESTRQAGFAVAAGVPLMVSAGLVNLSTVVLGSDTGLLHVAVALGRRVVMIIGSTEPGKCVPYGHLDWTVVPENNLNVAAVKPEQVLEACSLALAGPDRVAEGAEAYSLSGNSSGSDGGLVQEPLRGIVS
jgi:ADP-heptose:LPS heptosyltransferase